MLERVECLWDSERSMESVYVGEVGGSVGPDIKCRLDMGYGRKDAWNVKGPEDMIYIQSLAGCL